MTTDAVYIGFCVTALVRHNGTHEIARFFTTHYHRNNEIVSFDADGERRHFTLRDIVSITPHVYGTVSGKKISCTFPSLNVESTTAPAYAQTDEEYEESLSVAEEEYIYGDN